MNSNIIPFYSMNKVSASPAPPACTPGQVQIADYSANLSQWEVTLCSVSDTQTINIDPAPTSGNYSGVSWQVSFSGVYRTTMFKIYLGSNVNYTDLTVEPQGAAGTYLWDVSADDSTLYYSGSGPETIDVSSLKGGYIWILGGRTGTSIYDFVFTLS